MSLGPDDLVLCSGTLPRHVPFLERLEVARDAGYAAVSLWGRDYASALESGYREADLVTMLDDHGLVVAEIDPAWWWTPGATAVVIPPEFDPVGVFAYGEDFLFHMADVVGARSLNAAEVMGGSWTVEQGAGCFAALCDRAAEHGLLVHLEWLAWSKVPDLTTASEIVRLAGRANGGLNVDTWHCARSGTTPEELGAVDGRHVLAIQLDDGPVQAEQNLVDATLHERLLPGEGDLDLVGYVAALHGAGVTCPVGVEVFSDALHEIGARHAAQAAADGARSVLGRAGWGRA